MDQQDAVGVAGQEEVLGLGGDAEFGAAFEMDKGVFVVLEFELAYAEQRPAVAVVGLDGEGGFEVVAGGDVLGLSKFPQRLVPTLDIG